MWTWQKQLGKKKETHKSENSEVQGDSSESFIVGK